MKKHNNIVTPSNYTYQRMLHHLKALEKRYPFLKVYQIGKSVLGKSIYAIELGTGTHKVLCNGSHHAREWIATPLLMRFVEEYCSHLANNTLLFNYDITHINNNSTTFIVPMVNPDGVDLVINGLSEDNPHYSLHKKSEKSGVDFSTWKANIRGVDLNRNYNAGWGEYKSLEPSLGISGPTLSGYAGLTPESEPETQAMVSFTRSINPDIALAFHAQGEEIYWSYEGMEPPESINMATKFSKVSGYNLISSLNQSTSHAGYKDWFIKEFGRPAFTIEVGKGTTPVPIDQFRQIVNKNFRIILSALSFN